MRSNWSKDGLWGPRTDSTGLTLVSESDFFVESQTCAVRAIAAATASAPSFAGRLCLSLEPRIVEKDAETAEISPATCLQQLASLTVVDLQKKPPFLGGQNVCPEGAPQRGASALSLSFNRRIRNMSVGRFQLALRALDLRAPPCPRASLRSGTPLRGV